MGERATGLKDSVSLWTAQAEESARNAAASAHNAVEDFRTVTAAHAIITHAHARHFRTIVEARLLVSSAHAEVTLGTMHTLVQAHHIAENAPTLLPDASPASQDIPPPPIPE